MSVLNAPRLFNSLTKSPRLIAESVIFFTKQQQNARANRLARNKTKARHPE